MLSFIKFQRFQLLRYYITFFTRISDGNSFRRIWNGLGRSTVRTSEKKNARSLNVASSRGAPLIFA